MEAIDNVTLNTDELPHSPILLAAFEGWNDAGDAASSALQFLRKRSNAELLATISSEPFTDFGSIRPLVSFDDDGKRVIEWPDTHIYSATLANTDQQVVFVEGHEPSFRWKTFSGAIISLAKQMDVQLAVTVGALLADVPHTRPVEIYGTSDSPELAKLGLSPSTYEGPTGITGVLASLCRDAGVPTGSVWAAVPAYVPNASSPKASLALIEKLQEVLSFGIDTTELQISSAAYERQVTELIGDDLETSVYVTELEELYDKNAEVETADSDLATTLRDSLDEGAADTLMAEVEDFLKEQ